MKKLLLAVLVLPLVSCSSYFTRKGCEKVNWFQHAHDVAMNGKRLQEDGRLRECEKAETEINSAELDRGFKMGMENYCKPETALSKGASGEMFNYDFCDSSVSGRLKAQHSDGIKKFCTPTMAYSFASTGGIYKNQCSQEIEKSYMPQYRKGRQVYLRSQIEKNNGDIMALDREIREKQNQRLQINSRLATLPRGTITKRERAFDPATNSYKENTTTSEDPEVKRQRDDLDFELRQITNGIDSKLQEQRNLRQQNAQIKSEIEGLNQ